VRKMNRDARRSLLCRLLGHVLDARQWDNWGHCPRCGQLVLDRHDGNGWRWKGYRLLYAIAVALALAAPVLAQDRPKNDYIVRTLVVTNAALTVGDGLSTWSALHRPGTVEGNAIWRPVTGNRRVFPLSLSAVLCYNRICWIGWVARTAQPPSSPELR
jgi:hypothetical protein